MSRFAKLELKSWHCEIRSSWGLSYIVEGLVVHGSIESVSSSGILASPSNITIKYDHVIYPAQIADESYRECPVIDCGVHSQPVSGVLAN
jgi:hypothetical protein